MSPGFATFFLSNANVLNCDTEIHNYVWWEQCNNKKKLFLKIKLLKEKHVIPRICCKRNNIYCIGCMLFKITNICLKYFNKRVGNRQTQTRKCRWILPKIERIFIRYWFIFKDTFFVFYYYDCMLKIDIIIFNLVIFLIFNWKCGLIF